MGSRLWALGSSFFALGDRQPGSFLLSEEESEIWKFGMRRFAVRESQPNGMPRLILLEPRG
jgi:hypothetical protein